MPIESFLAEAATSVPVMQLLQILGGAAFTAAVIWAAGRIVARGAAVAGVVRFPAGAACVSLAVFFLLQIRMGRASVFLALGALTLLAGVMARPAKEEPPDPVPQPYRVIYWLTFAGFSLWYFVFALAPEIESDAAGYHLGLVSEYVRTHGMPARISFFDLLPQGMDMLFVPAFAIGRHSAAKLVHFAFLLTVVPLLRRTGLEAGMKDPAASAGALLFFLSPVAAVDGTAAYADIALVCASTATLWLMLRWKKEGGKGLLILAGLTAGFCYAIKPTLGLVPVACAILIYWRSRSAQLTAMFSGVSALSILPWMGRSLVLSGNPFAPFLNAWFPRDGIPVSTEATLNNFFGMFSPNFLWKTAYLDYTIWGGHQGMLGPAFLLLPVALFALRSKAGRYLLGYSGILLLTFPANTGTRFLLPAAGPASLALASVLPAPVSVLLLALQGAGSVRPVLMRYNLRQDWKLPPFPLAGALRLESEHDYLTAHLFDYPISRMIKAGTPPGAKVFVLGPFIWAYMEREPMVFWHSTQATQVWNELIFVQMTWTKPAMTATWNWPGDQFRAVRLSGLPDVRVPEARSLPGSFRELTWSPWTAANPFTMKLQEGATGFEAVVWPHNVFGLKLEVQAADSTWSLPPAVAQTRPTSTELRQSAMQHLRNAGYGYVVAPVANDAFEEIGRDMLAHSAEWGLEATGHAQDSYLFRIR